MKTAFVTMADSNFLIGCDVLVYSIKKNSPGFFDKCDAKILLALDKEITAFRDFDIVHVDPQDYPYFRLDRAKQSPSKLHMFTMTQFDKIIFYEADTLCVGDISDLHCKEQCDLYACRIYYKSKKAERTYNGKNIFIGDGWVINKNLLTGKFFQELIKTTQTGACGDQSILTKAIEDNRYSSEELSPTYDVVSYIETVKEIDPYSTYYNYAKMFHFTGIPKPWDCINAISPPKGMIKWWVETYKQMLESRKRI